MTLIAKSDDLPFAAYGRIGNRAALTRLAATLARLSHSLIVRDPLARREPGCVAPSRDALSGWVSPPFTQKLHAGSGTLAAHERPLR